MAKPREVVAFKRQDPITLQITHFGAVALGEAALLVSARDGLENQRITEAIRLGAVTGQAVNTLIP